MHPPDALADLPDLAELDRAAALIHEQIGTTPAYRWPLLDEAYGVPIWVKHENHTPVGAFKVRGGLVYLARLRAREPRVAGLIAATRGNHGQSIAFAARREGLPVTIIVPRGNAREKNAAMRALGAEVLEIGDDFQESLDASIDLAAQRGWHRVPSYHRDLVAGVGTWALELLRHVPDLARLYVPIGLGSGCCGAIAAKRALQHPVEIVGVVSAHAPAYARSMVAGVPVSAPVSTQLADGMACRTPAAQAFEVLHAAGIRIVEVTDEDVAHAMRRLFTATHNVAEGAGAAGFAAMWNERDTLPAAGAGAPLCGGNVDAEVFARVLAGAKAGEDGDALR